MYVTVDRIEGDMAVLENEKKQTAAVPVFLLPEISEGDVLEIRKDDKETQKRRSAARERMNKLWID